MIPDAEREASLADQSTREIQPGRIPIPLLLKLCGEVQSAVNRQAKALEGEERTKRPGPVLAAVSRECTLELFGIKKGSTTLNFAREAPQASIFDANTRGFEATSAIGSTLQTLNRATTSGDAFDSGVLDTLNKMGEVFERGVKKIEWIVPQPHRTRPVVHQYVPELRKKVAASIKPTTMANISSDKSSTVEGTLELTEGKCRISPLMGTPMLCGFAEEQAGEVYEAMRKSVKVSVDPKTRKIEHVEIQNNPPSDFGSGFFEAKAIDQLVAEQGIKPVTDLSAFSGAFPDEDIDEMLAGIYADRTV